MSPNPPPSRLPILSPGKSKRGAKASAAKVIRDDAEPDPEKVHLTTKIPSDSPADVVKDESRKGYDLLFVGLESSHDAAANSPQLTELVAGFDGPLALLSHAQGGDLHRAFKSARSRILVPVNGSPAARAGQRKWHSRWREARAPKCRRCSSPGAMHRVSARSKARRAC